MLMLAFMAAITFVACSDDDEGGSVPENVYGTWYGTSNNGKRSITVTLNRDMTGTENYEWNNVRWTRKTSVFTYSMSGNTIKCKGTYASADSDGNEESGDYTTTYTYDGTTITTSSFGVQLKKRN